MSIDITISEASRLAGVSRQTIYNQINSGELSRNVKKRIELSELLRVYPDISLHKEDVEEKNKNVKDEVSNGVFEVDTSILMAEINLLKKEVEIFEKIVVEKDAQINMLTRQIDKIMSMHEKLQALALPDYSNRKTGSWWAKLWGK